MALLEKTGHIKRPKSHRDHIADFTAWVATHRSAKTLEAYRSDLLEFASYWEATGGRLDKSLIEATAKYEKALKARGNQPATVRRRLYAVRSLVAHLHKNNDLAESVRVDLPPYERKRIVLDPEIVEEILDRLEEIPTSRARAVIYLVTKAQLRLQEVASLKVADLDLPRRRLRVSGKSAYLRLSRNAAKILGEYLTTLPSENLALFPGQMGRGQSRKSQALSTSMLRRIIRSSTRRLMGKSFGPEELRQGAQRLVW